MTITKERTNWVYLVFICIATAGAVFGMLYMLYQLRAEEVPVFVEIPIVEIPADIPTQIDENFLTQINACFIPAAAVYGYALRVTSEFRSKEEQDWLYSKGRTEDGHIVTWAPPGKSLHNYGFAVDVVDRWKGYQINWKRLGKIASFCRLEQVDDAHFENRGGLTTAQFEQGMKPMPLELPCAIMEEKAKANEPLALEDLKNCGAPGF